MYLKASRQINALKRVLKYLDENCRTMGYKSFVSSNFNYCPVAWMFYGEIRKDTREGAKFCFLWRGRLIWRSAGTKTLPTTNCLSYKMLGHRIFKCLRGLYPAHLNDMFIQPSLKNDLSDSFSLEQPKFRIFTFGLWTFHYYGSQLRNLLPYQIKKNTHETVKFKKNKTKWCHCKQRIFLEIL